MERIINSWRTTKLLVRNPFQELVQLDSDLNYFKVSIQRRTLRYYFLIKHGQCTDQLLKSVDSRDKTTGTMNQIPKVSTSQGCARILTRLTMNQLSFYMFAHTILLVWIHLNNSGRRYSRLSRGNNTLLFLILLIRDSQVETYKEMPTLWDSSQKTMIE